MILTLFLFCIFTINIIFFFNIKKISQFLNIYDKPNYRKIHSNQTSAIGGCIFFFNFFFFFLFDLLLSEIHIFNFFTNLRAKILFLFIASLIFLVGLRDDLKEINPYNKIFVFLFLLFIYFVSSGDLITILRFESFNQNISLGNLSLIFTVLCAASFMNAFNMFDGINNQSSIYILNLLIYFNLFSISYIFLISILLPLIIFGIYNYKNKLFLGNNGAYFLSFIFSVFIIQIYNYYPLKIKSEIIICILFLPILDMIRLFCIRFKRNQSPFNADNIHIHHLLLSRHGLKKTNLLIAINLFLPTLILYLNVSALYSLLTSFIFYLLILFYFSNDKFWKKKY